MPSLNVLTNAAEPEIPLYQGDMAKDLLAVSRNRLAEEITGGLSFPSKMPCPAIGISAFRCKVGSVLAEKEGSVCSECYARKGQFRFGNVQDKLERNYLGLFNPLWTPAMVFLVNYYCDRYFRWFHSGDLQGANHLRNIMRVATETPQVYHWLPTREAKVVKAVGQFPPNLAVRVSAPLVDGPPPRGHELTSTVVSDAVLPPPGSEVCPSREQGGKCGECRSCWDREVKNVAYMLH